MQKIQDTLDRIERSQEENRNFATSASLGLLFILGVQVTITVVDFVRYLRR